jgi:hypothetical protein
MTSLGAESGNGWVIAGGVLVVAIGVFAFTDETHGTRPSVQAPPPLPPSPAATPGTPSKQPGPAPLTRPSAAPAAPAVRSIHLQSGWEEQLTKLLTEQEQSCGQSVVNCNIFVGRALHTLWGADDFRVAQRHPPLAVDQFRYLPANEIADRLPVEPHWTYLGPAADQRVLNAAQNLANSKRPVVAVWQNPQWDPSDPNDNHHGHIVLIIDGELTPSGDPKNPAKNPMGKEWNMMVPNTASFVMDDLRASFIGGRLSGAFSKTKKGAVGVWVRDLF